MKMNSDEYLKHLGSSLENIRNLFGWRQEDIANRMGVSRSKVVAIEKESSKLNQSDAHSLFVACEYELYKSKETIKKIRNTRNLKTASALIGSSVFLTSPLFASSIIGGLVALKSTNITKLLPVVGGVFGSVWATASAKKKREKQLEEFTEKENIDFKTYEDSMMETIAEIEKNLLEIFLIKKWDIHFFYEKIHPELKLPNIE